MRYGILAALLLFASVSLQAGESPNDGRYWAQWRGPNLSGIAASSNPPLNWSEEQNVAWKVALPGLGSSTPVIWEDRLYVLTAVPTEGEATPPPPPTDGPRRRGRRRGGPRAAPQAEVAQRFQVLAIERKDGSVA